MQNLKLITNSTNAESKNYRNKHPGNSIWKTQRSKATSVNQISERFKIEWKNKKRFASQNLLQIIFKGTKILLDNEIQYYFLPARLQ